MYKKFILMEVYVGFESKMTPLILSQINTRNDKIREVKKYLVSKTKYTEENFS